MKRNKSGNSVEINWKHCFVCQKKHHDGLRSEAHLLENFASNLMKFWRHGKLNLQSEALADLNADGEPDFNSSFVKNRATFHWNCFKRFDNQKVQRLTENTTANEKTESVNTRTSQPKKKFGGLFCSICSEDDIGTNLIAGGTLHATNKKPDPTHLKEFTKKMREMALKTDNTFLSTQVGSGDLACNELYYRQ